MEKIFQIKKNGALLDSGAADLGHRLHLSNGTSKNVDMYVSKGFSFDINFSPDNKHFVHLKLNENPQGQKDYILSVFEKYSKFFSTLVIYAENYKFYKTGDYPNIKYHKLVDQKLHWHGYIRFVSNPTRKEYEHFFEKKIRPHFIATGQTNPHRATEYKKIKDARQLKDRTKYMNKQQPLVIDPIVFFRKPSPTPPKQKPLKKIRSKTETLYLLFLKYKYFILQKNI